MHLHFIGAIANRGRNINFDTGGLVGKADDIDSMVGGLFGGVVLSCGHQGGQSERTEQAGHPAYFVALALSSV